MHPTDADPTTIDTLPLGSPSISPPSSQSSSQNTPDLGQRANAVVHMAFGLVQRRRSDIPASVSSQDSGDRRALTQSR